MWVFCRAGFFSAVQKGTEGHATVCVRARVLEDFDRLRELYFPEMGRVQTTGGTDYPYRIYVTHNEWSRVMDSIARDVDYKNFKGMVATERGHAVADLYSDVWAVMYGAERALQDSQEDVLSRFPASEDARKTAATVKGRPPVRGANGRFVSRA